MGLDPRTEVSESLLTIPKEIARISALPQVRAAMMWLRSQEPQFAEWQLELSRIAAPPFGETARAEWLADRFRELALEDVQQDEVGNVLGLRRGTGTHCIVLSAHLDTVFPIGTPLNVKQQGSRLFGPGVSDNGAGVTAMLAITSAL